MADRNKLVEDAATEALIAAGKRGVKRAALELLSTDEERAAKQAEDARASKQRRWKLIAGGVLVLCVLIGLVGMLVSYWPWFLLFGILGSAGLVGWWRVKRRLAARRGKAPERIEVARKVAEPRASVEPRGSEAEELERDARAIAEDAATQEQSVEDELEVLKARLRERPGGGRP
jgi:hypothetical protein